MKITHRESKEKKLRELVERHKAAHEECKKKSSKSLLLSILLKDDLAKERKSLNRWRALAAFLAALVAILALS